VLIASHSLISEQAKFDLGANICRNVVAAAFRLGCRITTGTPFPPQNVYWNSVPVRSSTTTPLTVSAVILLAEKVYVLYKKTSAIVSEVLFQNTSLIIDRGN